MVTNQCSMIDICDERHFVGARLTNCGGWGCLHRVVLGPKILRKSRDWKSLIPMEPAPPPPLPHAVNAVNEKFCKYFATKVFFDGDASDRADSAFSRQHCLGKTTKGNNAFNRKLSILSLHTFCLLKMWLDLVWKNTQKTLKTLINRPLRLKNKIF